MSSFSFSLKGVVQQLSGYIILWHHGCMLEVFLLLLLYFFIWTKLLSSCLIFVIHFMSSLHCCPVYFEKTHFGCFSSFISLLFQCSALTAI
jgi:hypothetical protein